MSSLKTVQEDFQTYLMHSETARALPHIAPATPFNAEKRLGVYHHAYRSRLRDVLAEDYPKCLVLMGEEDFHNAAMQYIDTHPSHHFSVRYFGEFFPTFLNEAKPYQEFPILAEMARFEWATRFTLDAPNAPILVHEDLTNLAPNDWPNLVFQFHPSVRVERFYWDTVPLWKDIENEAEPRAPEELEAPIDWILWRQDLCCYFASLTSIQLHIAESIQTGMAFSEICESLTELCSKDEIPMHIMETISSWMSAKMLQKIKPS